MRSSINDLLLLLLLLFFFFETCTQGAQPKKDLQVLCLQFKQGTQAAKQNSTITHFKLLKVYIQILPWS